MATSTLKPASALASLVDKIAKQRESLSPEQRKKLTPLFSEL